MENLEPSLSKNTFKILCSTKKENLIFAILFSSLASMVPIKPIGSKRDISEHPQLSSTSDQERTLLFILQMMPSRKILLNMGNIKKAINFHMGICRNI